MQVTVLNLTSAPVYVRDLYTTLPANGTVTTSRYLSDLARMSGLQQLLAAGTVAVASAPTSDELASGVALSTATYGMADNSTPLGETFVIRHKFVADAAGTADDVVLYALHTIPPYGTVRVVSAEAFISTNIGGSTLSVYTQAAAAGTLLAQVSSAAAGHVGLNATVTASQTFSTGPAANGLFIRRSDRGVAGEITLICRRES